MTNFEIFQTFSSNKSIILFLLQKQIITIDETIINELFDEKKKYVKNLCHFLFPEIKKFIETKQSTEIEKDKIRQIKEEIINIDSHNFTNYE